MGRDNFMDPEEAQKIGLIDKVISERDYIVKSVIKTINYSTYFRFYERR